MIQEWWEALSLANKFLYGATYAATLVFVIQSIMTFLGGDTDADFDVDADMDIHGGTDIHGDFDGHSGMNLYTFRNLVNFLMGCGWSAILLKDSIPSRALLMTVSVLIGLGLVAIIMYMFKWLSTMQQSGTINVNKATVGKMASVYLVVPAERSGKGKVQMSINGSLHEFDAVTDGDEIPTGATANVIEVLQDETLLVESTESKYI